MGLKYFLFNWEKVFLVLTLAPEEHAELFRRVFSQLQPLQLVSIIVIQVAGMGVEHDVQNLVVFYSARNEGPVRSFVVSTSEEDSSFRHEPVWHLLARSRPLVFAQRPRSMVAEVPLLPFLAGDMTPSEDGSSHIGASPRDDGLGSRQTAWPLGQEVVLLSAVRLGGLGLRRRVVHAVGLAA